VEILALIWSLRLKAISKSGCLKCYPYNSVVKGGEWVLVDVIWGEESSCAIKSISINLVLTIRSKE